MIDVDEKTQFHVKIAELGETLQFDIDHSKKTVRALISELEDHFRREKLVRVKIAELKVGASHLLPADLLEDVLNDGDTAVAVVKGNNTKI